MTDFMIHFLLCNILISEIIGILLAARRIFRNCLSSRMRYHLWTVLLILLAVPFLPPLPSHIASFHTNIRSISIFAEAGPGNASGTDFPMSTEWMEDFALSVSRKTPDRILLLLGAIWIIGILIMICSLFRSALRLSSLKRSALPLQNPKICRLYRDCLQELNIQKDIPIYSTAFLGTPILAGLFRPCIYLPIRLLSDVPAPQMRYLLLHELQHYRHRDLLLGGLMNLALVFYWFHPLIRYAALEMRTDRETACDASVLELLNEDFYEDYGNTLLHLAQHLTRTPFPFAAGVGDSYRQIEQRILQIASYESPTPAGKRRSRALFLLTAVLLLLPAPMLSAHPAALDRYEWKDAPSNVSLIDLSAAFGDYEGSFVLYDQSRDTWYIYDMEHALLRTPPDSTYKIYDALFALDAGLITPEASLLHWDQAVYPFDAWNQDQTLSSAMQTSVNWYFQDLDRQLGPKELRRQIEAIGYGNQDLSGGDSCWLESSLKISPIEQTELLIRLYHNDFAYAPEQIQAVKDSIRLASSESTVLYGKTGTGRIEGRDVNGWFVGYLERAGDLYFFAVNIQAEEDASGSRAAELAEQILRL